LEIETTKSCKRVNMVWAPYDRSYAALATKKAAYAPRSWLWHLWPLNCPSITNCRASQTRSITLAYHIQIQALIEGDMPWLSRHLITINPIKRIKIFTTNYAARRQNTLPEEQIHRGALNSGSGLCFSSCQPISLSFRAV